MRIKCIKTLFFLKQKTQINTMNINITQIRLKVRICNNVNSDILIHS